MASGMNISCLWNEWCTNT